MKRLNNVVGAMGEVDAAKYLQNKKYKILETNYKNKLGEIDIIALQNKVIVFVEVKNRSTLAFGLPAESVTPQKQYRIRRTAEAYLQKNKMLDSACRFDVIEIVGTHINHIENAF